MKIFLRFLDLIIPNPSIPVDDPKRLHQYHVAPDKNLQVQRKENKNRLPIGNINQKFVELRKKERIEGILQLSVYTFQNVGCSNFFLQYLWFQRKTV